MPDVELDAVAPVQLKILYQDAYLVAVDKPAGMLVHRSFLDKHETLFVMQTLRDQLGQHVFPVHRLDRPTSGVLLFALSSEVARLLTEQHQQESWRKFYLAVVRGYVQAPLLLDYALKEQLDKVADKKARQDKVAQDARTAIWPLAQVELPIAVGRYPAARYSLVALQPQTGRKHQLRRHLAHLFHPIVGDTSHGDGKHNKLFAEHFGNDRLLLVAKRLEFLHPISGELMQIDAGIDDLAALFARFNWPVGEDFYQQLWPRCDAASLPLLCHTEAGR
ncbi:tRNA pseudouridine(65) synthase TruC [Rheinheimera sp. 4Y26]|uniref:tRNA pseudouridine(65) synthase TruC n=1 Tax=Rheinheimera sp. 4Y26 TaxID=2977811 RepID=UPI0021B11C3B|nr:tRNA pseudouridine(65) synthase TruC [Rheinheimera sp. 4Y26]MCT6700141.1 tRNA pseudouridine(65) synthase TruC [Rheinheimera sp. 4Y26]